MAALYLEELDILLATSNYRVGNHGIELHLIRIEIKQLPRMNLNLLESYQVLELVDNDRIAHLVVLPTKTKVLWISATAQRDRMDDLHRRLKGQYARAIRIRSLQIDEGPDGDFIVS